MNKKEISQIRKKLIEMGKDPKFINMILDGSIEPKRQKFIRKK